MGFQRGTLAGPAIMVLLTPFFTVPACALRGLCTDLVGRYYTKS